MKKIYLFLFFLITLVGNAQDFTTFQKLRNLSKDEAVDFANKISGNIRKHFVYGDSRETERALIVSLINIDADKEKVLARPYDYPDDIVDVYFTKFHDGENKSLEIEGTTKYKFYKVKMKYLDLFPTWKEFFQPNADLEKTVDNFQMRDARIKENKLDWLYKFNELDKGIWEITMFY